MILTEKGMEKYRANGQIVGLFGTEPQNLWCVCVCVFGVLFQVTVKNSAEPLAAADLQETVNSQAKVEIFLRLNAQIVDSV